MSKNKEPKKTKELIISPDVRKVAEEVIKAEKLELPAKIEYVLIYPYISKSVLGRCRRNGLELKFFSKVDYLIEMSGDVWDALDDKTKYVLTYHELLHVLPILNEKSGEWKMRLRKHDVMDFYRIIKKHGIDWFDNLRTVAGSVYDLSPEKQEKITI
jgi:hypothetical protein